jgi:hypothetical protein
VRLREHWHSLKENLVQKSKLAQYAYEEGHKGRWDFWKLKVTAGIETTTNQPIWHA